MKLVLKILTGHLDKVFSRLNLSLGQYKRNYKNLKIGITGDYNQRHTQHLANNEGWERMIILYETTSENYANDLEKRLVDQHYESITNTKAGGSNNLTNKTGFYYLYVLLGR